MYILLNEHVTGATEIKFPYCFVQQILLEIIELLVKILRVHEDMVL